MIDINFDNTITAGNVFSGVGGLLVAAGFYFDFKYRLRVLEGKMDGLSNAMIMIAAQHEQIKALQETVNDLKHGQGFVLEPYISGRRIYPTVAHKEDKTR